MRPYTVGNHCCQTNDVAWDEDTDNDEFADDGVVVAAATKVNTFYTNRTNFILPPVSPIIYLRLILKNFSHPNFMAVQPQ